MINEYIEGKYQATSTTEGSDGILPPVSNKFTLQASDIILRPYLTEEEIDKQNKTPGSDSEAWYRRHCLNGFLSTPKFVMTLTDISLALINQTNR
jgi:hypothetical protein